MPHTTRPMQLVRDVAELEPYFGCVVVPTMGALHEGHRALTQRARRHADAHGGLPVVVTVFVNPTQFNRPVDLETYPEQLDKDCALCAQAGADCVFAPSRDAVYPPDAEIPVPALPSIVTEPGLEDAYRPGHFAGVAQVCMRLFDLTRSSAAVFGEKDWQQLALMQVLSERREPRVEIIGAPTVREPDGVAMSSRNLNLTAEQREHARGIVRGFEEASAHPDPIVAEARGAEVVRAHGIDVEYFAIRDARTLEPVRAGAPARVLAAGLLGDVRLIDNAPWPGFTLGG